MEHLTGLDLAIVVAYFAVIVLIGILVSRRERSASDYFLAGRALPWWLIGISLIASNTSTEHFVGMAGSGVTFGLAIASYEWMAAITLVIVARWFVPRLLAHNVTTMPDDLERRFDIRSRGLLAGYMLLAYVFVAVGGWGAFREQAADKLPMVLPLDHPELPWFAVFFGGLWIANLFYWGCNQFITQRVLGARDVR